MSSQPVLFQLPTDEHFDGSWWYLWKETILSAMNAHGVYGYLDSTIKKPDIVSSSTLTATTYWGLATLTPDEWVQCDAYTKSMITLNMKNPLSFGIKSSQTSVEAWKALTTTYNAVSTLRIHFAQSATPMELTSLHTSRISRKPGKRQQCRAAKLMTLSSILFSWASCQGNGQFMSAPCTSRRLQQM